nr:hypothetical protein [uncultured Blautia sp.]
MRWLLGFLEEKKRDGYWDFWKRKKEMATAIFGGESMGWLSRFSEAKV